MANQPKKYTKFVATAATATLVASAIVPVASAASFSDVAETNSHAENINALVEAGIIKGFEDGTFKPGQELTRGQVVKMLGKWVEAQGVEIPADYATKARFTDVAVDAKDQELVKYAALVADAKVFNGSNGVLNAAGKISRENMALVLDRAYTAINKTSLVELASTIEDVKVADLATAKKEAQEAIQALRDLGITVVDNFNPKASVTRGQFASFLNKTINTEVPAVELTVKSAVATSANTLEVVLSDDTKHEVKLAEELKANVATEVTFSINEKEYTATVTFVVENLTVKAVEAINAEEIKVTFSKDVEKVSASKLANYEIRVNGSVVTVADVAANSDSVLVEGNTVTLRLASALTAGDKYSVQVNDDVKDTTGKAAERFASEQLVFASQAAPALKSVKLNAAKTGLELTFDKPVKNNSVTLIKADGINLATATLVADDATEAGNYVYTYTFANQTETDRLKADGSHKVVVFDATETSINNPAVASVLNASYEVVKNAAAPQVVAVTPVNANKFFVELSVASDLVDASDIAKSITVKKGTHTFATATTYAASNYSTVSVEKAVYKKKPGYFVVVTESNPAGTDLNPLYATGETSANLSVTFENFKEDSGEHLLGSKYTGSVTLTKDSNKPAVKATTLTPATANATTGAGTLFVEFEATLKSPSAELTSENVIVRDKDGIIVTSTAAYNASTNSVEIPVTDITRAPYTVEFKANKFQYDRNVTSVAAYQLESVKNDAIKVNVTSEVASNFKFVAFNGQVTTVGTNVIEVNYGKKMDASAKNPANYTLDGAALPTGSTVDFIDDTTKVRITLPAGSFTSTSDYRFTISSDVKTVAGEQVVANTQTKAQYFTNINFTDDVAPKLVSAKYLVTDNTVTTTQKIELTFDEALAASVVGSDTELLNDFSVLVNGTKVAVSSVEDTKALDKVITLVLATPVNLSQAATVSIVAEDAQTGTTPVIKVVDTTNNKAIAGTSVTTSGTGIDVVGILAIEQAAQQAAQEVADLATANQNIAAAKTSIGAALELVAGSTADVATVKTTLEALITNATIEVVEDTNTAGTFNVTINSTVNGQVGTPETVAVVVTVAL